MSLLPFGSLPVYGPRCFVPADFVLSDPESLEELFDELEARLSRCTTTEQLQAWLVEVSELTAVVDENGSRRYIAMTCHTDDPVAEQSYLEFVEKIEPRLKPRQFRLAELYLKNPLRNQLPSERFMVYDRDIRVRMELFRQENVPLETEESRLGNEYQKLIGSLTVQYRGEEKTLTQMSRLQEEPNREVREEAWRLVAQRRLQEVDSLDHLMDELIRLRDRMASNAGFSNFRDYAFRNRGRFDYGPRDCEQFHDAIEAEVMPLMRELQSNRRQQLGVPTLRPWDLNVDPLNRPPLVPFKDSSELESASQTIFDRIDPALAEDFRTLRRWRLLDLANRKGKAPGGYQSTLNEVRLPFIFMNAVGLQRDVETLLHEAGHAFHALAVKDEPLVAYRSAPIEFCEVASMAMELLAAPHLDVFYSREEAQRARRVHLEGIVGVFPWIATVDAFQHWLYLNPGHSTADRRAAWTHLMERFGGEIDWSGEEAALGNLWHKQLHIFLHPFYYIEYGIAQLGALQVWSNASTDPVRALADYRAAMALGGSRPLPELFQRAGCPFDFSRATVRPLIERIRRELDQMR